MMAAACQFIVRIGLTSFYSIFSLIFTIIIFSFIVLQCPKITSCQIEGFQAPLVPYVPSLGMFLNWYLVAQLNGYQSLMLIGYIVFAIILYFVYGYSHSRGSKYGWKHLSQCDDEEDETLEVEDSLLRPLMP